MARKRDSNSDRQIKTLRDYLNKEFGEEYGGQFTYEQTKRVYDKIGCHYDPQSRVELDAVVGEVMGTRRVFDESKFRPFDPSELELQASDSDIPKTKLNRFGEIMGFFALISGVFFLSSNITGNTVSNLSNTTLSLIGVGLLFVGLVVGFFLARKRK